MRSQEKKVGFIGLGKMGGAMTEPLLRAGYSLKIFDISPERMKLVQEKAANFATEGAQVESSHSIEEVMESCNIVMTSLPMPEVWLEIAEKHFIPGARPGQIFIDMGTSSPEETRRIGAILREKGAHLLDSPVSGGGGPANGLMRIFVGGDKDVFEANRSLFEVLGESQYIVYCGPNGCGQIIKGVNQMAMGLVNAAFVEAIAYGILSGIPPMIVKQAVGGPKGFREQFSELTDKFIDGSQENIPVKIGQMYIFIQEAARQGFKLPLSSSLNSFCENGEKTVQDANRLSQSFWNELVLKSSN